MTKNIICKICGLNKPHEAHNMCLNCYFKEIRYSNPIYRERKKEWMREYWFKNFGHLNTSSFSYGLYLRKLLT